MQFFLTNHAKTRIKQRDLPMPFDVELKPVKNSKHKKEIRKICKVNGFKNDNEHVYWRNNHKIGGKYIVYVTVIKGVGKYLVITAFKF